jgi:hypothetical protein
LFLPDLSDLDLTPIIQELPFLPLLPFIVHFHRSVLPICINSAKLGGEPYRIKSAVRLANGFTARWIFEYYFAVDLIEPAECLSPSSQARGQIGPVPDLASTVAF